MTENVDATSIPSYTIPSYLHISKIAAFVNLIVMAKLVDDNTFRFAKLGNTFNIMHLTIFISSHKLLRVIFK